MSTDTTTPSPKPPAVPGRGGKFLTFSLGKEEFGIPILAVREIIGYVEVTAVPRTPAHVRGVINLRGQVISVIDLRGRFGMPAGERTEQTCIVVVDVNLGGRKVNAGVIVDRVSEVLHVPAEQVEDVPEFGTAVSNELLLGLAKVGKGVKILLDIDRALATSVAAGAGSPSPAAA